MVKTPPRFQESGKHVILTPLQTQQESISGCPRIIFANTPCLFMQFVKVPGPNGAADGSQ